MLDFNTLLIFVLACAALSSTPGPDMLLIASRSAVQGKLAGLASWAGAALGTYIHALAAALGLNQLFLAEPAAYDMVRYAGALYLLYMAWQAFRARTITDSPSADVTPAQPLLSIFQQGLITNILNPKMLVFNVAFFPQFISPEAGSITLQVLILASIINIVGFFINGIVILSANQVGAALSTNTKAKRLSQYFLGTVFLGLALRLAIEERP